MLLVVVFTRCAVQKNGLVVCWRYKEYNQAWPGVTSTAAVCQTAVLGGLPNTPGGLGGTSQPTPVVSSFHHVRLALSCAALIPQIGTVKNKQDCILRPDSARAAWTRQYFGSCGVAPRVASTLPTRAKICVSSVPSSASPVLIASPAPSNPSPGTGSGTNPSDGSSGANVTVTGAHLPRTAVLPGQVVPPSVTRIEAARSDGVADVTSVSADQRVVVAVVDSGVDKSHWDLEYVGGQSFHATDLNADVDDFGHGEGAVVVSREGCRAVGSYDCSL